MIRELQNKSMFARWACVRVGEGGECVCGGWERPCRLIRVIVVFILRHSCGPNVRDLHGGFFFCASEMEINKWQHWLNWPRENKRTVSKLSGKRMLLTRRSRSYTPSIGRGTSTISCFTGYTTPISIYAAIGVLSFEVNHFVISEFYRKLNCLPVQTQHGTTRNKIILTTFMTIKMNNAKTWNLALGIPDNGLKLTLKTGPSGARIIRSLYSDALK